MSEPVSCVCGARLTCEPSQINIPIRCPACAQVVSVSRAEDNSLRILLVATAVDESTDAAVQPMHPKVLRTRDLASPERKYLTRLTTTIGVAYTLVGVIVGLLSCSSAEIASRASIAVVVSIVAFAVPPMVLAFCSAFMDRGEKGPVAVSLVAASLGVLTVAWPATGLGIAIPLLNDVGSVTLFVAMVTFAIGYITIVYYCIRILTGLHLAASPRGPGSLSDLFRPDWIAANRPRASITCALAILLLQLVLTLGALLPTPRGAVSSAAVPPRTPLFEGAERPWDENDLFDAESGLPLEQRKLAIDAVHEVQPLTSAQDDILDALLREVGRDMFPYSFKVERQPMDSGVRLSPGTVLLKLPQGTLELSAKSGVFDHFGHTYSRICDGNFGRGTHQRALLAHAAAHLWLKEMQDDLGHPLTLGQVRQLVRVARQIDGVDIRESFFRRRIDGTIQVELRAGTQWFTPDGTVEYSSPEDMARQVAEIQQIESAKLNPHRRAIVVCGAASAASALVAVWLLIAAIGGSQWLRTPILAQIAVSAIAALAWLYLLAEATPVLGSRLDPRVLSVRGISTVLLVVAAIIPILPLRHAARRSPDAG